MAEGIQFHGRIVTTPTPAQGASALTSAIGYRDFVTKNQQLGETYLSQKKLSVWYPNLGLIPYAP